MSMSLRKGWILLAILCMNADRLGAEPCDCTELIERMRLLEQRIESLESRLSDQQSTESVPQAGVKPQLGGGTQVMETAEPLQTPSIIQQGAVAEHNSRAQTSGLPALSQAESRFYLIKDLATRSAGEPDAAGLVPFQGQVSFQPRDYGVEADGLFSKYDDPSLYPTVAVRLTGQWRIDQPGAYQLVVRPKPSREGASAVRGTMIFSIRIDGRAVIPKITTQSWKKHARELQLSAGLHRVEIDALAQSPGFGPSPTDSQLLIDVRGPGEAAPRPLLLLAP
jgi:hypothetical protein